MNLDKEWRDKLILHHWRADEVRRDQVMAVMLYGSQNYGLATEKSDVDTKAMIVPPIREVLLGKPKFSHDCYHADGLTCIKDFRGMFDSYLKGNVNFLETLYTDYYLVSPMYEPFFDDLRAHRDLIANAHPTAVIRCAAGFAHQKFDHIQKVNDHNGVAISNWGYDPKALMTMRRLAYFIYTFKATMNFQAALESSMKIKDELLGYISDPLPKPEALARAHDIDAAIVTMKERAEMQLPANNHADEAREYLDELVVRILCEDIRTDLINNDAIRREYLTFLKKIFVL